jgi:hypothetical protein
MASPEAAHCCGMVAEGLASMGFDAEKRTFFRFSGPFYAKRRLSRAKTMPLPAA